MRAHITGFSSGVRQYNLVQCWMTGCRYTCAHEVNVRLVPYLSRTLVQTATFMWDLPKSVHFTVYKLNVMGGLSDLG